MKYDQVLRSRFYSCLTRGMEYVCVMFFLYTNRKVMDTEHFMAISLPFSTTASKDVK
jgi:hypothetical protein